MLGGRANPINVLIMFGIVVVWLVDLPIFLFRLLKALNHKNKLPSVRALFFIPKFIDKWLALVGFVAIFLALYFTAYVPSRHH